MKASRQVRPFQPSFACCVKFPRYLRGGHSEKAWIPLGDVYLWIPWKNTWDQGNLQKMGGFFDVLVYSG